MTEYFEVHRHDGPARLGELRLDESVTTPALVGDCLEDYGSLWTDDRDVPDSPGSSSVVVLPHRAMPSGTPSEVVQEKQTSHDPVDLPSASVVSIEEPEASGHDLYVLTGLREGNSRNVVEGVLGARRSLEPDSALYLPSVATPSNVALLTYLGVDGFDADHAVVEGKGLTYMTRDSEFDLERLDELPCSCSVCKGSRPEELGRDEVADHNLNALEAELANVRGRIREGRLREYVEGQCRSSRWQVEALRLVDQEFDYAEERTPVVRGSDLDANTSETLDRVEIRRFARRVVERYEAPRDDVAVLLPCSAKKPYSESKSHSEFRSSIRGRAHEVVVTSPLGVVPHELELTYPAGHYDTPVTGRWDAKEREFVSGVLEEYLSKNEYDRVVAHLPEEGYAEVLRDAADEVGVDPEFTVPEGGHPRDDEALDSLDAALEDETQPSYAIQDKWFMRGVTDYQFGEGSFDDLFSLSDVRTESRLPRLRLYADAEVEGVDAEDGDVQVATLTPNYGYLALTLEGARCFDPPKVKIDDFVPSGSVLAPGVVDAPESVRVGDEVAFEGPSAFGMGRAKMFGEEMRRSTRGVAVDVRHVEEK